MNRYLVYLESESVQHEVFSCENDSHVLEVVNDILSGSLDVEHSIRIVRQPLESET